MTTPQSAAMAIAVQCTADPINGYRNVSRGAPLFHECEQHCIRRHQIVLLERHPVDYAVARADDGMFHFHRFEDDQGLTFLHRITGIGEDFDDAPRHHCRKTASGAGIFLFEMEGVNEVDARKAMRLASAKLPIKTKFATRFAEEKAS